ncbi:MAG: hypothetical protein KatS3mg108_0868 [Isosphaeraceae bacterium]|jgi:hypothetical protein|nr:MAG: hypothetical protein KatS3mg108_0868 [Isosphaeraceae bacterium]
MGDGLGIRDSQSVGKILACLESGRFPDDPSPEQVIAALAQAVLGRDEGAGPGLLRQRPLRPRLRAVLEEPELARVFPRANRAARLALSAGLLQINDFWDESHAAAQEADDLGERRVSAYWHAIAHRREPDPSNAMYWFRRVGHHPIHPALAAEAPEFATTGGGWDASAFVSACTRARPGSDDERRCRRVQRLEMELLLAETMKAVV